MSAGTKVTIALVVLFAVVLGIYYGFGGATPEPMPPAEAGPVDDAAETAPGAGTAAREAAPTGVLARSVDEAFDAGGGGEPAEEPETVLASDAWVLRAPPVLPGPEPQTPPVMPPPATPAAGTSTYTVQPDDTMWDIASELLGDGGRWSEIAALNPHVDADRLRVGQRLRVPDRDSRVRLNGAASVHDTPPRTALSTYHTVRSGESLSTIADRYYDDGTRWRSIYEANRSTIGGDPHRLDVGMRLRIP